MRKYKRTYKWRDTELKEPKHICAHKNCQKEGLYRAPVSRLSSRQVQYFCLDHIKEFNKNWNYFEGMSDAQFSAEMQRAHYGGDTWPMGFHDAAKRINFNAERMKDPFDFFDRKNDLGNKTINAVWPDMSEEELDAIALLQLSIPFERPELRNAYRKLARKYHPDSAENKNDTDTIKKINQAYDILKKLLQRYENI